MCVLSFSFFFLKFFHTFLFPFQLLPGLSYLFAHLTLFSPLLRILCNCLIREKGKERCCDKEKSFGNTLNNSLSDACTRSDASEISLPHRRHVTMAGCWSAIEKSPFLVISVKVPPFCPLCHPQSFSYPQPAEVVCSPGAQQSEKGLLACSAAFSLLHLQFFPSATGSTADNNST